MKKFSAEQSIAATAVSLVALFLYGLIRMVTGKELSNEEIIKITTACRAAGLTTRATENGFTGQITRLQCDPVEQQSKEKK